MQSGERIAINGRDYRLSTVLSTGAGSYGQVWEAADAAGRAVAVKFINVEAMTQADPTLHGHWRAHLEREIAFLTGLNADQSRHVVALLDHGVVDGQPALVLERLQANLGQWLARQRREDAPAPDLAQILDWAEQILDGLDAVHQAGFVYRDLKFSNLLVGEDGARLKLADFGSLKREDGDNTRSFIGTPATMAPEQVLPACQGADGCEYAVDYRADYYALGLLLFALLTDRPTTAAQRRLGQLLALHGQAGAGQQRAQLGGLDDDERELLRRSVEFWTVPVRPEQGGGTAALLVNLTDRLLARDPADRPADGLEIRAVLDAARVNPLAAPTLMPDWKAPLPPILAPDWSAPPPAAEPPNRHLRRNDRPTPRSRWRWALLAGALGLAGALAWAIVRPVGEIGPDQAESLSAVIMPPTADDARPAEPVAPTTEPVTPLTPPEILPVASPAPPATTDAPVAEAPEPEEVAPPVRPAPAKPRPASEPASKPRSPVVVATPRRPAAPATVESRLPARAKPAANVKSGKLTPTPAFTADRPVPVERPNVSARPAPAERPAWMERPPAAPVTATRIAKPTLPSPAPAAPEPPRRSPATARAAAPAPRADGSSKPITRSKPTPSMASHPLATQKPDSKSSGPVVRVEPPSRIASRPDSAPALPPTPIKLESRPDSAPALPPIKLESRAQSAPSAPPPIELVSRSSAAAPPRRPASAPTVASAQAKPQPRPNSSPTPARSADPITQLRDEAGRAATAVGDWGSRTSTTVGGEVRRGLETADRTVGQWTGHCNQADGCGRNTTQVERRDRWSDRHRGGTVTQRESPARSADEGFAEPPPRRYRDYR